MSEIKIFESAEFGKVRTVMIDDKSYFCANDVANALGYSNPRKAVSDHCKGVTKCDTPTDGGVQALSYIPEGDIYRLIVRSKLPSAEKFERWVFDEILPTIRKTGGYVANDDLFIATYLPAADEQTKLLFKSTLAVINNLNEKIVRDKPLVDFANQVADTSDLIDINDMAKLLCSENIKIGRNKLFEWLRNKNILMSNNTPYQQYINNEYFRVKEVTKKTAYGTKIYTKTYVTGKGQIYITQKIKEEMAVA